MLSFFYTRLTSCKLYSSFLLLLCTLTIVGCASVFHKVHKIPPGTEKYQVLNTLGRPEHASVMEGQEIWTYKFKYKGQVYTQSIFFEKGYLIKKGNIEPFSNYFKALKAAKNKKDYEVKARLLEKQNKAGFKRGINSKKDPKAVSQNCQRLSRKNCFSRKTQS